MDYPLVSVLMTAYNREKYIAEAIESVLAQTYPHFELIIVDDGSKDATVAIANDFAKQDERVKVLVNEKNLGQFANRNYAAFLANGAYLMYVDSDDTIKIDAIAYVINLINQFPEIEYATLYFEKDIVKPTVVDSAYAVRKHFFDKAFLHVGPGGTFISKRLFMAIEGFPNKYGPAGDVYYNIKAATNSSVLLMPYNYLNYRRHEAQEINNVYSYLYNGYRYFDDLLKMPALPLSETERSFLSLKNKRRFVVNNCKWLVSSKKLGSFFRAFKLAKFTINDFLLGIFHWQKVPAR